MTFETEIVLKPQFLHLTRRSSQKNTSLFIKHSC